MHNIGPKIGPRSRYLHHSATKCMSAICREAENLRLRAHSPGHPLEQVSLRSSHRLIVHPFCALCDVGPSIHSLQSLVCEKRIVYPRFDRLDRYRQCSDDVCTTTSQPNDPGPDSQMEAGNFTGRIRRSKLDHIPGQYFRYPADFGADDKQTGRGGLDDTDPESFREGSTEVDLALIQDLPTLKD